MLERLLEPALVLARLELVLVILCPELVVYNDDLALLALGVVVEKTITFEDCPSELTTTLDSESAVAGARIQDNS